MKGILKIYHPEETLKYHIKSSYCKAIYSNSQHFLEVEIVTDEGLGHIEDDSLQYHFPQISFSIFDFPITHSQLNGMTFAVNDNQDETFTEVNLFCDEEAYLYENELSFSENAQGDMEVTWKGMIEDFYTNAEELIPFKLKCHFGEEILEIDEE